jgi:hypothetical protein
MANGNYFRMNGIKGLEKALLSKAKLTAAKAIVKVNTEELAEGTQQRMAQGYRHGFSTGATARSTLPRFRDSGMTGYVEPQTNYFPYLERGTRFMAAMPTLRPSFLAQQPKFVTDLRRLVH